MSGVPVTPAEALLFCNSALRNADVSSLTAADLVDIADALTWFRKKVLAEATQSARLAGIAEGERLLKAASDFANSYLKDERGDIALCWDMAHFEAINELFEAIEVAQSTTTDGWRPIETAPREGMVLGYSPSAREDNQTVAVKMRNGKPFLVNGIFAFDAKPITHWRPLPTPPQAIAGRCGGGEGRDDG